MDPTVVQVGVRTSVVYVRYGLEHVMWPRLVIRVFTFEPKFREMSNETKVCVFSNL